MTKDMRTCCHQKGANVPSTKGCVHNHHRKGVNITLWKECERNVTRRLQM